MPFCATEPIAALRAGGIERYQGKVSSKRLRVAVASSPAIDCSQARCLGVATGRSTGSGVYIVQAVLVDCLLRHSAVNLVLLDQLLKDTCVLSELRAAKIAPGPVEIVASFPVRNMPSHDQMKKAADDILHDRPNVIVVPK